MFRRDIKLCSRSYLGYDLMIAHVTWNVQAHQDINNDERFYSCMSAIDHYVSLNIQPPVGLDQMSIYVFSYFYDIAFDAGLIVNDNDDHSSTITTIPIRVLKQTAKKVCRESSSASTKTSFFMF
ncbi:unnamed protein product [Rotaria sordida]|uniref:Uncharacterized protein n=1 Tax=Rotaria sordida TaxID=392033 RepID=A0A814LE59_9BILA|nr:unnamed protein product [Rotaria sordida]